MIKNIRVEAYASLPRDGGGLRVDAHFLELAHVAPQLERADLEQVAEKHPPLQAVLEAQPQLVVFFGFACGDSHGIELLKHCYPPRCLEPSIPAQRTPGLLLDHPALEAVALLIRVDPFAQP